MNQALQDYHLNSKPILADVILLGRVTTKFKAGIPSHVLSIIQSLSNEDISFINLVPSLNVQRNPLKLLGSSCRQINTKSVEIVCNSIFTYKTLALSPSFFYSYFKLLHSLPRAVVHVHLPDPFSIAASLFCTKRKIVATFHADLLNKGIFGLLYKMLLVLFASKDNVVFVIPTPDHINGTSVKTLSKHPVVVPFIFTDTPLSTSEAQLVQSSYSSEVTRFLFVGRHVPYKGIHIAIKAFMKLPKSILCELVIVGQGPLTSSLRELASPDERIVFKGLLSDSLLLQEYLRSNVFVLPSISKAEAFGIVQVEAMLHHCLCLSSQLNNGVNFVNQDGVSGFSFPASDIDFLSDLMYKLCTNKSRRNSLMRSAREYSLKTFASNDLRDFYLNLYHA
jgi:glycosyltransferase involved in cell wall biosynthesis